MMRFFVFTSNLNHKIKSKLNIIKKKIKLMGVGSGNQFFHTLRRKTRPHHGTSNNRLLVRHRCARQEQSLIFDLCKAFDEIESSHKSDIFLRKELFSVMRAKHALFYHLLKMP